MKFKAELLEGESPEGEVEIFNTEENELILRTFTLDSGQQDYTLLKTALQIGVDEMFLYGWLKDKDNVTKVRYKLKPIKL